MLEITPSDEALSVPDELEITNNESDLSSSVVSFRLPAAKTTTTSNNKPSNQQLNQDGITTATADKSFAPEKSFWELMKEKQEADKQNTTNQIISQQRQQQQQQQQQASSAAASILVSNDPNAPLEVSAENTPATSSESLAPLPQHQQQKERDADHDEENQRNKHNPFFKNYNQQQQQHPPNNNNIPAPPVRATTAEGSPRRPVGNHHQTTPQNNIHHHHHHHHLDHKDALLEVTPEDSTLSASSAAPSPDSKQKKFLLDGTDDVSIGSPNYFERKEREKQQQQQQQQQHHHQNATSAVAVSGLANQQQQKPSLSRKPSYKSNNTRNAFLNSNQNHNQNHQAMMDDDMPPSSELSDRLHEIGEKNKTVVQRNEEAIRAGSLEQERRRQESINASKISISSSDAGGTQNVMTESSGETSFALAVVPASPNAMNANIVAVNTSNRKVQQQRERPLDLTITNDDDAASSEKKNDSNNNNKNVNKPSFVTVPATQKKDLLALSALSQSGVRSAAGDSIFVEEAPKMEISSCEAVKKPKSATTFDQLVTKDGSSSSAPLSLSDKEKSPTNNNSSKNKMKPSFIMPEVTNNNNEQKDQGNNKTDDDNDDHSPKKRTRQEEIEFQKKNLLGISVLSQSNFGASRSAAADSIFGPPGSWRGDNNNNNNKSTRDAGEDSANYDAYSFNLNRNNNDGVDENSVSFFILPGKRDHSQKYDFSIRRGENNSNSSDETGGGRGQSSIKMSRNQIVSVSSLASQYRVSEQRLIKSNPQLTIIEKKIVKGEIGGEDAVTIKMTEIIIETTTLTIPPRFGKQLPAPENIHEFIPPTAETVDQIAARNFLSTEEFIALNPQFKSGSDNVLPSHTLKIEMSIESVAWIVTVMENENGNAAREGKTSNINKNKTTSARQQQQQQVGESGETHPQNMTMNGGDSFNNNNNNNNNSSSPAMLFSGVDEPPNLDMITANSSATVTNSPRVVAKSKNQQQNQNQNLESTTMGRKQSIRITQEGNHNQEQQQQQQVKNTKQQQLDNNNNNNNNPNLFTFNQTVQSEDESALITAGGRLVDGGDLKQDQLQDEGELASLESSAVLNNMMNNQKAAAKPMVMSDSQYVQEQLDEIDNNTTTAGSSLNNTNLGSPTVMASSHSQKNLAVTNNNAALEEEKQQQQVEKEKRLLMIKQQQEAEDEKQKQQELLKRQQDEKKRKEDEAKELENRQRREEEQRKQREIQEAKEEKKRQEQEQEKKKNAQQKRLLDQISNSLKNCINNEQEQRNKLKLEKEDAVRGIILPQTNLMQRRALSHKWLYEHFNKNYELLDEASIFFGRVRKHNSHLKDLLGQLSPLFLSEEVSRSKLMNEEATSISSLLGEHRSIVLKANKKHQERVVFCNNVSRVYLKETINFVSEREHLHRAFISSSESLIQINATFKLQRELLVSLERHERNRLWHYKANDKFMARYAMWRDEITQEETMEWVKLYSVLLHFFSTALPQHWIYRENVDRHAMRLDFERVKLPMMEAAFRDSVVSRQESGSRSHFERIFCLRNCILEKKEKILTVEKHQRVLIRAEFIGVEIFAEEREQRQAIAFEWLRYHSEAIYGLALWYQCQSERKEISHQEVTKFREFQTMHLMRDVQAKAFSVSSEILVMESTSRLANQIEMIPSIAEVDKMYQFQVARQQEFDRGLFAPFQQELFRLQRKELLSSYQKYHLDERMWNQEYMKDFGCVLKENFDRLCILSEHETSLLQLKREEVIVEEGHERLRLQRRVFDRLMKDFDYLNAAVEDAIDKKLFDSNVVQRLKIRMEKKLLLESSSFSTSVSNFVDLDEYEDGLLLQLEHEALICEEGHEATENEEEALRASLLLSSAQHLAVKRRRRAISPKTKSLTSTTNTDDFNSRKSLVASRLDSFARSLNPRRRTNFIPATLLLLKNRDEDDDNEYSSSVFSTRQASIEKEKQTTLLRDETTLRSSIFLAENVFRERILSAFLLFVQIKQQENESRQNLIRFENEEVQNILDGMMRQQQQAASPPSTSVEDLVIQEKTRRQSITFREEPFSRSQLVSLHIASLTRITKRMEMEKANRARTILISILHHNKSNSNSNTDNHHSNTTTNNETKIGKDYILNASNFLLASGWYDQQSLPKSEVIGIIREQVLDASSSPCRRRNDNNINNNSDDELRLQANIERELSRNLIHKLGNPNSIDILCDELAKRWSSFGVDGRSLKLAVNEKYEVSESELVEMALVTAALLETGIWSIETLKQQTTSSSSLLRKLAHCNIDEVKSHLEKVLLDIVVQCTTSKNRTQIESLSLIDLIAFASVDSTLFTSNNNNNSNINYASLFAKLSPHLFNTSWNGIQTHHSEVSTHAIRQLAVSVQEVYGCTEGKEGQRQYQVEVGLKILQKEEAAARNCIEMNLENYARKSLKVIYDSQTKICRKYDHDLVLAEERLRFDEEWERSRLPIKNEESEIVKNFLTREHVAVLEMLNRDALYQEQISSRKSLRTECSVHRQRVFAEEMNSPERKRGFENTPQRRITDSDESQHYHYPHHNDEVSPSSVVTTSPFMVVRRPLTKPKGPLCSARKRWIGQQLQSMTADNDNPADEEERDNHPHHRQQTMSSSPQLPPSASSPHHFSSSHQQNGLFLTPTPPQERRETNINNNTSEESHQYHSAQPQSSRQQAFEEERSENNVMRQNHHHRVRPNTANNGDHSQQQRRLQLLANRRKTIDVTTSTSKNSVGENLSVPTTRSCENHGFHRSYTATPLHALPTPSRVASILKHANM